MAVVRSTEMVAFVGGVVVTAGAAGVGDAWALRTTGTYV